MGKRGPQPTPTHLKVLHGTEKPEVAAAEPQPEALDPRSREWWDDDLNRRFADTVEAIRPIVGAFRADEVALTGFVFAQRVEDESARSLLRTGVVIKDGKGDLKVNPIFHAWRAAAAEVRLGCTAFGLTPSARAQFRASGNKVLNDPDLAAEAAALFG